MITTLQYLKDNKILLGLCGTLLLAVMCLLWRGPEIVTKVETRIEYRDHVVEKVVEKEVVKWKERKVVETRADGSSTVTEEKEGSQVVDTTKLAERVIQYKERVKSVKQETPLKNYSITGFTLLDIKFKRVYGIEAGARLGNLPLLVTVFVTSNPQVGLGIRVEF